MLFSPRRDWGIEGTATRATKDRQYIGSSKTVCLEDQMMDGHNNVGEVRRIDREDGNL